MQKKLIIEVDESLHKKLKKQAIDEDKSLKTLVTEKLLT